jgi:hypothetical protein
MISPTPNPCAFFSVATCPHIPARLDRKAVVASKFQPIRVRLLSAGILTLLRCRIEKVYA